MHGGIIEGEAQGKMKVKWVAGVLSFPMNDSTVSQFIRSAERAFQLVTVRGKNEFLKAFVLQEYSFSFFWMLGTS